MDNAIKYANFIKRVFTTNNSSIRKSLLKTSNDNIITAISEILLNVYYKSLPAPISPQSLKKLKKCKPAILKIINKATPTSKRRELLVKNSESLIALREVFK